MNTDVEDLLRQGMLRYTADLRAPAGMVRMAERRRRQRLAQRSVIAGATLAACAAAAVAVAQSALFRGDFAGLRGHRKR